MSVALTTLCLGLAVPAAIAPTPSPAPEMTAVVVPRIVGASESPAWALTPPRQAGVGRGASLVEAVVRALLEFGLRQGPSPAPTTLPIKRDVRVGALEIELAARPASAAGVDASLTAKIVDRSATAPLLLKLSVDEAPRAGAPGRSTRLVLARRGGTDDRMVAQLMDRSGLAFDFVYVTDDAAERPFVVLAYEPAATAR